jgi:hypothetical protein
MRPTSISQALAATGAALLVFTACSSGSDANVDKGVVIAQIMGELQGSVSGLPVIEQEPLLDCWNSGLQDFTTDELVTLRDAGAIPAVADGWEPIGDEIPADLNAKAQKWYDTCVPTDPNVDVEPVTP